VRHVHRYQRLPLADPKIESGEALERGFPGRESLHTGVFDPKTVPRTPWPKVNLGLEAKRYAGNFAELRHEKRTRAQGGQESPFTQELEAVLTRMSVFSEGTRLWHVLILHEFSRIAVLLSGALSRIL
jgi:hypothetical protein